MVGKRLISQVIISSLLCFSWAFFPPSVQAQGEILGVHILSPGEIETVDQTLGADGQLRYITIPLSLQDLEKREEWQRFLDTAHERGITPLVRFTTRFENGAWKAPSRADVVKLTRFLTSLDWKRENLHVILFNEPNHAAEWGGSIDPEDFARVSAFAADWLATEQKSFVVLPAGLDLAADGKNGTMEAFAYWKRALAAEPTLLEKFDGWTSHSYPNPAFSSNPSRTDKRSLRGYQHELSFLSGYTTKQFPVYITETGWDQRTFSSARLQSYYRQAYEQIWKKDTRVVAVTPFLFRGAPGAFSQFSFLDEHGKPTKTYEAYRQILSDTN